MFATFLGSDKKLSSIQQIFIVSCDFNTQVWSQTLLLTEMCLNISCEFLTLTSVFISYSAQDKRKQKQMNRWSATRETSDLYVWSESVKSEDTGSIFCWASWNLQLKGAVCRNQLLCKSYGTHTHTKALLRQFDHARSGPNVMSKDLIHSTLPKLTFHSGPLVLFVQNASYQCLFPCVRDAFPAWQHF